MRKVVRTTRKQADFIEERRRVRDLICMVRTRRKRSVRPAPPGNVRHITGGAIAPKVESMLGASA